MTDATTSDPTADDAEDLVLSQHVSAPPETVFDFLVDQEKMLRWLGVAVELNPKPGGRFWFNANGTDCAAGEYVEIDRPSKVVFTFGWEGSEAIPPGSSTVTITLSPASDDTTDVVLRHSGLPRESGADHGRGWTYFAARLAVVVAGGDPGPAEPER